MHRSEDTAAVVTAVHFIVLHESIFASTADCMTAQVTHFDAPFLQRH